MTARKEIRHRVIDRIKNGISGILVVRQLRLRQRLTAKGSPESKNKIKTKKPKKEIYPEELIAIIASIIIIFMVYGALGLVYNVFA